MYQEFTSAVKLQWFGYMFEKISVIRMMQERESSLNYIIFSLVYCYCS